MDRYALNKKLNKVLQILGAFPPKNMERRIPIQDRPKTKADAVLDELSYIRAQIEAAAAKLEDLNDAQQTIRRSLETLQQDHALQNKQIAAIPIVDHRTWQVSTGNRGSHGTFDDLAQRRVVIFDSSGLGKTSWLQQWITAGIRNRQTHISPVEAFSSPLRRAAEINETLALTSSEPANSEYERSIRKLIDSIDFEESTA